MGVRTGTRQRMVTSAALLMRGRGVAGTSVAGTLIHSRSPRGSVGFHFPGGRVELLTDALRWAGDLVSSRLRAGVEGGTCPAELFRGVCEYYKETLAGTGFTAGCPVGAAAQEAYADPALGPVAAEIIDEWVSLLAKSLIRAGREPADSHDIALACICSIEGAITMARVRHSVRPIDLTLAVMLPLLSAPATATISPANRPAGRPGQPGGLAIDL